MRILFSIHLFLPKHTAGAENYAYHCIKYLQSKGHTCRVLLHQATQFNISVPYVYDGIEVHGNMGNIDQYLWADVLVTHLDFTHHTVMIGNIVKRPVLGLVHNAPPYKCFEAAREAYIVYNSQEAKNLLNYKWPSMVLTPPCDYRKYDLGKHPDTNEYITLVSLNHNKGGEVFYRLAEAMPDKKFLGITGSYDPQIKRELPNVTIWDKQLDMSKVYNVTRVMLMPSLYESWGMVAGESIANGIPVVACETFGLKENLDYAGIFMPQRSWKNPEAMTQPGVKLIENDYDIQPWIDAIRRLDDPEEYNKQSELARKRSRELDPAPQLDEFEQFVSKIGRKQLAIA